MYFSLVFVFLLSGLSHGANWTYVAWGAITAAYLVVSMQTARFRRKVAKKVEGAGWGRIHNIWRTILTFCLVTFSFIFIRARNLEEGVYIARNLPFDVRRLGWGSSNLGLDQRELIFCFLLIIGIFFGQWMRQARKTDDILSDMPVPVRWAVIYAGVLAVLISGQQGTEQFIYFKF